MAGHKCTVCRFQNSKWHTSYDYNFPVYHVNVFILSLSDTVQDLGVT